MAKAEYRSAVRSRVLINAALADLLQEKPLEKITVTDVVNRAGINRGTFYAHYQDIPDVIDRLIQKTFNAIRDVLSDQSVAFDRMPRVLLGQIQNILQSDLSYYRKVMNSNASAKMQDQLVSIVVEYMLSRKSAFAVGRQQSFEAAIRFCAGGLSHLYREWFAGTLPYTLDELTDLGEQMILRVIHDE